MVSAKKQKNSKPATKHLKLIIFLVTVLILILVGLGIKTVSDCCFGCETYTITSINGNEVVELSLELADTNEEREKGLMHRKSLDKQTGMLFDFVTPDYYSMWMKNTYVPLDMIFLNGDGVIIAYVTDRQPLSEDFITPCTMAYDAIIKKMTLPASMKDKFYEGCESTFVAPEKLTRYVLEVPAGTVEEFDIQVGDVLKK